MACTKHCTKQCLDSSQFETPFPLDSVIVSDLMELRTEARGRPHRVGGAGEGRLQLFDASGLGDSQVVAMAGRRNVLQHCVPRDVVYEGLLQVALHGHSGDESRQLGAVAAWGGLLAPAFDGVIQLAHRLRPVIPLASCRV